MFSAPEQLSNAAKAHCESQLTMMTALANTTFETVEKLVELNMHTMKESLDESTTIVNEVLSAKDPQTFFSLPSAQHHAEQSIAYGRQLASIASNAQAEFTKIAEANFADANRKVFALLEEAGKNAPAGSENAVAMMKNAFGNANASYEQFSKATKQVVGALEENLSNSVGQFTQAAQKTSHRAKK